MKKLYFLLLFPLASLAQTTNDSLPLHHREIPRHNLSIDLGIATPMGSYSDVARTGLTTGLSYDLYFNKHIGFSGAVRHTYNETAFEQSDLFSSSDNAPQNEKLNSVTAGIVGSRTFNRFQIDGFARFGLAFLNTNEPAIFVSQNNDELYTATEGSNDTSAILETGLRFNYYFRRSVQVYFSPQYQTTLGDPLSYLRSNSSRPDTGAILNQETACNFTNFFFNVGVKFAVGKKYTSGALRDDSL